MTLTNAADVLVELAAGRLPDPRRILLYQSAARRARARYLAFAVRQAIARGGRTNP